MTKKNVQGGEYTGVVESLPNRLSGSRIFYYKLQGIFQSKFRNTIIFIITFDMHYLVEPKWFSIASEWLSNIHDLLHSIFIEISPNGANRFMQEQLDLI